jgi:hypothetical protein
MAIHRASTRNVGDLVAYITLAGRGDPALGAVGHSMVINRALVYGSLTAMLGLVYFGGVAMTQVIFRTLTGQEEQPQLAIVVSTLVIAALFNPLRRRI